MNDLTIEHFGPTLHETPVVSVLMITYNHERFIRQAIESVFMQEVYFPIELVIGEDCSTDATRTVIREVCQGAPISVRLVTSERNVGMHRNLQRTLIDCKGAYVALLEGDDYWLSVSKLDRQVDLMRSTGFVMCGHRVIQTNLQGEVVCVIPSLEKKVPAESLAFMEQGCDMHTSSLLFVNHKDLGQQSALLNQNNLWLDYTLKLLLADRGRIGFLPEVMSVYRNHSGGISIDFYDRFEFWLQSKIVALRCFDVDTQGRYADFVTRQICREEAHIANCRSSQRNVGWKMLLKPEFWKDLLRSTFISVQQTIKKWW